MWGKGPEPCGFLYHRQQETNPSGGQSFPRSLPETIPLPKGAGYRQQLGVKNWLRGATPATLPPAPHRTFNVSVLWRERMLDEPSCNGSSQGFPSSAPGWRNRHFRAAELKAGLVCACRHREPLQGAQQPRVAPCMAIRLTLTQPRDFLLVPKISEQMVVLLRAPTGNKT